MTFTRENGRDSMIAISYGPTPTNFHTNYSLSCARNLGCVYIGDSMWKDLTTEYEIIGKEIIKYNFFWTNYNKFIIKNY